MLSRRGWSLDYWFKLSPMEQEYWIACDVDRSERINEFLKSLEDRKVLTAEAYAVIRMLGDLV